jgi:hypothetical protein
MADVKLVPLSWPPEFVSEHWYLILHAGNYFVGRASRNNTHGFGFWQVHVGSYFMQFNQLDHDRWMGTQVWDIQKWTVVDHIQDILEAL